MKLAISDLCLIKIETKLLVYRVSDVKKELVTTDLVWIK